jgi:hypothetical protein
MTPRKGRNVREFRQTHAESILRDENWPMWQVMEKEQVRECKVGVRLRHFLDKPGPRCSVSDEEHARRGVMRGNELVRNSMCALVLGGQCYRDAGLLGGEGTISINGDVGRRAEVGVSKEWPHTTVARKSGKKWGYRVEQSGPVLLPKANRLAAVPSAKGSAEGREEGSWRNAETR